MWWLTGITLFFICSYTGLMLYYRIGWSRLLPVRPPLPRHCPTTCIIIPARNEAKNIARTIKDLRAQHYEGAWEVIVVDDHSRDETAALVQAISWKRLTVLQLKETAGKKAAIEAAAAQTDAELLITTDADCRRGSQWLKTLVAYYAASHAVLVGAPVVCVPIRNLWHTFQAIDMMGLAGAAAGSFGLRHPHVCNGANLAYSREAFEAAGGFEGLRQVQSGDDVLLMQKFKKFYPQRFAYAAHPDAIVRTRPIENLKKFLQQRMRWGGHVRHFSDAIPKAVMLGVSLFNLWIVALGLTGFWERESWILAGGAIVMKAAAELILLVPVVARYQPQLSRRLPLVFPLQVLHIPYMVATGFLANFTRRFWKGRPVRTAST